MAKIFTNFALSISHLLLYIILTMSNIIHPLHTDIQPPKQFTFPFCYTPHPLCELAAEAVQHYIRTSGVCDGEGGGKMFGVLVVRNEAADGQPLVSDGAAEAAPYAFLAAYSGLLSGRNDWTFSCLRSSMRSVRTDISSSPRQRFRLLIMRLRPL